MFSCSIYMFGQITLIQQLCVHLNAAGVGVAGAERHMYESDVVDEE